MLIVFPFCALLHCSYSPIHNYIFMPYFCLASQTWLLGRLLPLTIGSYVPDGDAHWECYMLLLSITVLATAVEVTVDSVSELTLLVQDYLHVFNSLYPNKITPKMHYLLHLPDQMKK